MLLLLLSGPQKVNGAGPISHLTSVLLCVEMVSPGRQLCCPSREAPPPRFRSVRHEDGKEATGSQFRGAAPAEPPHPIHLPLEKMLIFNET
ncbi:hypothetical protein BHM03_00048747 [Ensete ventricosum]|nr:hypothetical protein BHM03_00048747 [Ensete ventricosum]